MEELSIGSEKFHFIAQIHKRRFVQYGRSLTLPTQLDSGFESPYRYQ